jgi:(2Fe-2S) ferredoxin
MKQYRLYICHGPQCGRNDLGALRDTLSTELATLEAKTCEVIISGCQGRCEYGPNMNIFPGLIKYYHLTPDLIRRIVREHIAGGQPVDEYVFRKHS